MIIIDTISIAKRLQQAGMEEATAKAVTKEIAIDRERLATKEDIDRLERAFGRLEGRILAFMALFAALQSGIITLILWLFTRYRATLFFACKNPSMDFCTNATRGFAACCP